MNYKLNSKALDLAMIRKGYSINELSKKCGVGKATISRALREMTVSRQSTIYKMSKALDIDVMDLLEEK